MSAALAFEIRIEDPAWNDLDLEALAQSAGNEVVAQCALEAAHSVSVLACDDASISKLNEQFRGKAYATNVLSWPSEDLQGEAEGADPLKPREAELGDIAIAYQTCAREAEAAGIPIRHHVTHLMVHGCLHLLGYDHETDADATLMEAIEMRALENLGVPSPY